MDNQIQTPVKDTVTKDTIKNLPTKQAELKPKEQLTKSNNKDFTYTYILSTPTQKEQIDLTKYKKELQEIFKNYFGSKLISSIVTKDRYTLILNEVYTRGEKLRVGRLISANTDLKQYAKRVAYNGGQDKSGQIFIIKKEQTDATNTK